MANAPARHLVAVPPESSTLDDILLCKDRSLGHDWPHIMQWQDGEKIPQGRGKRAILVSYRICTCLRCGTVRREMFVAENKSAWWYKITNGNRYLYPRVWFDIPKMEQAEIRKRLRDGWYTQQSA